MRPAYSGLRNAIAPVGGTDQAFAIGDVYAATREANETFSVELIQGHSNPRATHSEHKREKFVGQGDLIAAQAVLRHEQPARQALLECGGAVGERGMRGLDS